MTASRGEDIRNYIPAFKKGAKLPVSCLSAGITGVALGSITSGYLSAKAVASSKMFAAFLSGTIVSGKITRAIAHGLGVKPKFVVVAPLHTLAQAISATPLNLSLAAASAATTTNFYVIGNQPTNGAMKYVAYVQI